MCTHVLSRHGLITVYYLGTEPAKKAQWQPLMPASSSGSCCVFLVNVNGGAHDSLHVKYVNLWLNFVAVTVRFSG